MLNVVEVTGFEPANSLNIDDDRSKYKGFKDPIFENTTIIALPAFKTASFLPRLFNRMLVSYSL